MSLSIRTVTVELLRAGPPHNQLMSPLTQYLGVCGDAGAGVVVLPYEHAAFERRLKELRYESGTDIETARRLAILRETGEEVARILGSIPSLPGSLTHDKADGDTLTHLRLVLSASELAMLPFELSKVPTGSTGSTDNWLALQTHAPVCITRHIRSVPTDLTRWPLQPRILFVSANADDVPYKEHLDILRNAVSPWTYSADEDAGHSSWLTALENATLEQVQEEFDRGEYTHVHILAHGAEDETTEGTSFGLALRDEEGDVDVVSGERFASALATLSKKGRRQPTVVTVASCDSGNVGEVVKPGGSFAHSLHQSGIPLVVASQFPLSMKGSGVMTEILYSGLLWGKNPWLLLQRTRSELHSQESVHSHDWASVVVYEALPATLEKQLEEFRYLQARRAVNAALRDVDDAVQHAGEPDFESVRQKALERVERAVERLPNQGSYELEGVGLRASSAKRIAETDFKLAVAEGAPEEEKARHFTACHDRLDDSLEWYRQAVLGFLGKPAEAVQRKASLHWVLVQMIALEAVLGREMDTEYWATAKLSAEMYLDLSDVEERAWAHGSLAELWLLRTASGSLTSEERAEAADRARDHAAKIVRLFPRRGSFPVYSTRRQFERYVNWWGDAEFVRRLELSDGPRSADWSAPGGLLETAQSVVATLDKKTWKAPED